MSKKKLPKYPLVWQKDDFFIKIFCSIPNIATGILITTKNATFVVDPGDGILRDLNQELDKKKILEISDIFVSHGHHDHVGGVWSLLTYMSVMNRKKPLKIYFPKGCLEIPSIYKAFSTVYKKEIHFNIDLIEIENSKSFRKKSVSIKPFKVLHKEPSTDTTPAYEVPSLGFKFTYDGKSICYGGDTAYCDNLIKNVKDSDLAIIEAGAEDNTESDLHLTIEQAEQIGSTAKNYFLVHVPE